MPVFSGQRTRSAWWSPSKPTFGTGVAGIVRARRRSCVVADDAAKIHSCSAMMVTDGRSRCRHSRWAPCHPRRRGWLVARVKLFDDVRID